MRVAIIGAGAQERYFKQRADTEIWCLNHILFDWAEPVTRMFNIHPFKLLEEYGYDVEGDSEWAKSHPETPFYVADPWPKGWLPKQVIFPRAELSRFSRGNYHCGSFDWMVAFALSGCAWPDRIGVCEEIELHGISLALEHGEPISARACLEYWCGYAEAKGIKVTTAEDCDLFFFYHLVKSHLVYGYDETPVFEDRTKEGAPYHLSQARSAAIRARG